MFYKKQNFPESGELVICTVKKILHNSVFVDLDEYESKEGIIHISEIAPGRIRSIHEYVREGKKIVCKVLRINTVHNNIELSLRRVSVSQKIKKQEDITLEQKAEKMLEYIATSLKQNVQEIYNKVGLAMIKEYGSLNAALQEAAKEGETIFTKIGVEKQIASKLTELVKQRIKPPEIKVSKTITVKNMMPNGIESIKESFKKSLEHAKKKGYAITATYLGSPRFKITLVSTDYKKANGDMEDFIKELSTAVKESGGVAELLKEK